MTNQNNHENFEVNGSMRGMAEPSAVMYKQYEAPQGIDVETGRGLKYYIETWGCQMN